VPSFSSQNPEVDLKIAVFKQAELIKLGFEITATVIENCGVMGA